MCLHFVASLFAFFKMIDKNDAFLFSLYPKHTELWPQNQGVYTKPRILSTVPALVHPVCKNHFLNSLYLVFKSTKFQLNKGLSECERPDVRSFWLRLLTAAFLCCESHAGAADAFCCRLLTWHTGSLTLNNLELIMWGKEEHSSPSMHSVFFPAPVRALEGRDNDS